MSENLEKQSLDNNPDPNYWRSFKELYNDKETIEKKFHEFEKGITDEFDPNENLSGLSRRKFLALLGASAAFAGVACTDYRDKGEIIPYNIKPEEITLGKPNFYASTCSGCNSNCGILIKTREGRPIKIDGNPDHPVNQGKICSKGQASILNLYDPERIKSPLRKNYNVFSETDWKSVDDDIINVLTNAGNKEIALVTHKINSPTTLKLLNDFKNEYPNTKIYSYELFNDSIRNSAWQKSYGSGNFPLINWNEAEVILALESDFLGADENRIENSRLFAQSRDVDSKKFNRLYVAESGMSLTGINADYRLSIRPENQFEFVLGLISELKKKGVVQIPLDFNVNIYDLAKKNNLDIKKVDYLINDLSAKKGKSIIYAGNSLPEDVHIAVNLLNEILGNSKLYRKDSASVDVLPISNYKDFEELVNKIKNNQVAAVIHLNSNPVYHLPEDIGYKDVLSKFENVFSLSETMSESCQISKFILPINHNFESWGDYKTRTGIISLSQPVIMPLHNSRQLESILLTWIKKDSQSYSDTIYHDYLKTNWQENIYPKYSTSISFDKFWYSALHNGFISFTESINSNLNFNFGAVKFENIQSSNSGFTLVLKESYTLGDGRYANNGWLQELPHPVSKITWDNYAAISHNTAKSLGLKDNDLIEVEVSGRKLRIPVFVQAGNKDNTVIIELGYGREYSGIVATGVGFNANKLLSKNSDYSPWIYKNVKISKIQGKYILASTQEHHSFDIPREQDLHLKRHIVVEGTVSEYLRNPSFIKNKHQIEHESVYKPFEYKEVKWGMSIDLNKCLGCGDCVVACNVENNVPVVGKDQVLKSREMQWLRIDRYYSGSPDDPKISTQPMLCQHCDLAPCENVCPVVATTHSLDGLNQMTYNRCVGTRYCSNNCPYKVRRFNFFNYRDHFRNGYQENPVFALLNNPEVTVRSRGVMEKCTFCVQRISDARSEAIRKGRKVKGSDVRTACQDACPTNAIKFGDINNPEEEFYKYRNHELGYYSLSELNIKPNVTYIAKLRNIHSEEV